MLSRVVSPVLLLALFLPGTASAVPLGNIIGAMGAVTSAGASALSAIGGFRGNLSPFSPLGIGAAVLAYCLSDTSHCWNVVPGTKNKPPAPKGWSDPDTPPITGSPCYSAAGSCYGDINSACGAIPLVSGWKFVYALNGVCYNSYNGASPTASLKPSVMCPSYYSWNGSTCILSSNPADQARVPWPSDGQPTIVQGAGGLAPASRDPDPPTAVLPSDTQAPPAAGEPSITRSGVDSAGNPTQEQVIATGDGGTDVIRWTESQNPSTGQSVVQKDTIHTDANGNVTSQNTTIYNNTTINNINNGKTADTSGLATEGTLASVYYRLGVLAQDSTAQATNRALATVAQDVTVQATNRELAVVAQDATVQATNRALANVAQDVTVQETNRRIAATAQDVTLQQTNRLLPLVAQDSTVSNISKKLDTVAQDSTLQKILDALGGFVAQDSTLKDTNTKLDDSKKSLDKIKDDIHEVKDGDTPEDKDLPSNTLTPSFDYNSDGGGCPSDPAFEAFGKSISFPLSYLCTFAANYFRPMAISAALVTAFFIVFV